MLFYNYCIQLREKALQTPHVDLTRAYFFAGRGAERQAGYSTALWYFVRAALVQRQVIDQAEGVAGTPPLLLEATRSETAAVYFECARVLSSYGYTAGVVALASAAARLSLITTNPPLAQTASVLLFNHLLARPDNHDHTALLFSLTRDLDALDSQQPQVRRRDLSGKILQAVRLAQEMPGLKPPRKDLARKLALRAVAMQRLGRVDDPPYIPKQVLPQLISQTGLSNEVVNLHFPSEDLWPANEPLLDRGEWLKKLDAAAPAVDLAAEFPALPLDAEGFPKDGGDLANVSAQLEQMLPNLLTVAKRPSPTELEAGITQYLAAMK
jgi:hypothetical protein